MKYSLVGNRPAAQDAQAQSGVPAHLRGPWFHVSKNNIDCLSDSINYDEYDDEYTWFSRSPMGGGHAGGCVLLVYVVSEPNDKRVFAAACGDALGTENGSFLERWWLRVHKSEVDKLMVVAQFSEEKVEVQLPSFQQDPEYIAIRQASIAMTFAAKPPQ